MATWLYPDDEKKLEDAIDAAIKGCGGDRKLCAFLIAGVAQQIAERYYNTGRFGMSRFPERKG